MIILYSGTLDTKAGGPATSTYHTMNGLSMLGIDTRLIMYPLSFNSHLSGDKVTVYYASSPLEHKFAYSRSLKKEVKALGEFDIYHAQGIWQYPTYALIDVAREKEKPYLITPRGMLYPQDIAKSNKWLKKISLKIRLLQDLNRAACIQVTCEEEMKHCRNLGIVSPIAVIPNPVEIKEHIKRKKDNKFRLGYLGRLSPRKNVEGLIYAFAALKEMTSNAELLIIGDGDKQYETFLKKEVYRLKLCNVRFSGFLSGAEKNEAIDSLSVLALPSEFENFGMVIAEALVHCIPCIATHGAPWKELKTHRCGWWIEYGQDVLTNAVKEAIQTSVNELEDMGARGRELICEHYATATIASRMKTLYEWILRQGDKPDFVYE